MPRVVHFEIPADDAARASQFYQGVFGWSFTKWGGPSDYWLITTGPQEEPGINGGMLRRPHPGAGVVNTVQIQNLDATVEAVTKSGGAVAMPKMAVPGVGWLAYCTDTEGNLFGLMQPDAGAK